MQLFKRPHICACEDHVDFFVDLEVLRKMESYAEFEELLREELREVYGAAPLDFHGCIMYSTQESPQRFAQRFGEAQLKIIRTYDNCTEKACKLDNEHKSAVEEHNRYLEEQGDKKLTRKQRKEEERKQKSLKAMLLAVSEAEYDAVCWKQQLAYLFSIKAIRVPLS